MIIATLPLAVLLVEMMVQSLSPSVTVDPLLAKNVLWFFGHPVVYLLLFPTVALYYLLIPRFAGRPLVAGNIIAIGWAIAVTANVIVWAHHIYIDYPSGSPQAAMNTVMEPLTFSVTIVSALSLYSLFFTMYRSRFVWNAASTALFLGLVELAARRALGRDQRDDRLRPGDPQHALDRRPLPPDGVPRHRARDHRRDVRVPAGAREQAALQRGDGALARLADVRLRDRELGDLALPGAARRAAALRGAAAPLRRGDAAGRAGHDRPRRSRRSCSRSTSCRRSAASSAARARARARRGR